MSALSYTALYIAPLGRSLRLSLIISIYNPLGSLLSYSYSAHYTIFEMIKMIKLNSNHLTYTPNKVYLPLYRSFWLQLEIRIDYYDKHFFELTQMFLIVALKGSLSND